MVTKKQLGFGFISLGVLGMVGVFGIDIVDAGNFRGIGPLQQIALGSAGLLILVGITLLPLGDRPA